MLKPKATAEDVLCAYAALEARIHDPVLDEQKVLQHMKKALAQSREGKRRAEDIAKQTLGGANSILLPAFAFYLREINNNGDDTPEHAALQSLITICVQMGVPYESTEIMLAVLSSRLKRIKAGLNNHSVIVREEPANYPLTRKLLEYGRAIYQKDPDLLYKRIMEVFPSDCAVDGFSRLNSYHIRQWLCRNIEQTFEARADWLTDRLNSEIKLPNDFEIESIAKHHSIGDLQH